MGPNFVYLFFMDLKRIAKKRWTVGSLTHLFSFCTLLKRPLAQSGFSDLSCWSILFETSRQRRRAREVQRWCWTLAVEPTVPGTVGNASSLIGPCSFSFFTLSLSLSVQREQWGWLGFGYGQGLGMVGSIRFRVMTSGILGFVCMGYAVMGFSAGILGFMCIGFG